MSSIVTTAPRPQLFVSELTKLITLRSLWITAALTWLIVVLAGWSQAGPVGDALRTNDPGLAPGASPETVGFDWVALGLIGIIIIGVISASSEYVSGQLRTSLVAASNRLDLYLAKCAALTVFVTTLGILTVPLLSVLSQAGLAELSVIDGTVPASLILRWVGAIAFWDAIALIGFALGILFKQTLIPLFALIVVSQLSLMLLLLTPVFAYLPTVAGVLLFDAGLVTGSYPDADPGTPTAAVVTAVWTVGLVVVAGRRFSTRDTKD